MPRKSNKAAGFRSEAEEADWYSTPEGRRQTQREFTRAVRAGTLVQSPGLKISKSDPKMLQALIDGAKKNATRAISIRIPVADLERARQIADHTGVGYQSVLKRAIRDGLNTAVPYRPPLSK
jgi:hypothetical protein